MNPKEDVEDIFLPKKGYLPEKEKDGIRIQTDSVSLAAAVGVDDSPLPGVISNGRWCQIYIGV